MKKLVATCVMGGSCALASGGITSGLLGIDTSGGVVNRLVEIDRETAAVRVIGTCGVTGVLSGLAYDAAAGVLYAADADHDALFRVDAGTGAATRIGSFGSSGGTLPEAWDNVNALAIDPFSRVLYAADTNNNALLTIDTETGQGTRIARITGVAEIEGLTFDTDRRVLLGISSVNSRLVEINTATGAANLVAALPAAVWRGLEFDPESGSLYASAVNRLYRIDARTGSATLVGLMPGVTSVQGLAVVPGPSVMSVALLAMAGRLARRHR